MKQFFIGLLVFLVDLFVFLFLGLLLMEYEDFYHPSKGEWYSFESMTGKQLFIYLFYNFWIILNLLLIGILLFYFIRRIIGKKLS